METKININKFVAAIIEEFPAFKEEGRIPCMYAEALKKQGLMYKDGEIVKIQYKAGDVLTDDEGFICLFKNYYPNEDYVMDTYCHIFKSGEFDTYGSYLDADCLHYASQEQYNAFFSRMKEEGYEWDAENLELKEIKPDPIEEKIKAKLAYLNSKGIYWSDEEWNGYREGLEDMYNSQNK